MSTDRGRDTSWELVEVRTVLSRAESAIKSITGGRHQRPPYHDEDEAEMLDALGHVVEELKRWRRTGRPLKR